MLRTPLCRQLGIEYPLFCAGMGGGMSGPELAAAVSNAGACGVLGMGGLPAPYIRQQIHQTRTLTNKPFGVNILLPLLPDCARHSARGRRGHGGAETPVVAVCGHGRLGGTPVGGTAVRSSAPCRNRKHR
jgi:Nitronate monooxygenase